MMTAPLIAILAGGEGRRMGGGKPLRRLGGERLVDRAERLARHWSDDVRLSLRQPGQVDGLGLPALIDDPGTPGPLAGLQSALAAAREAGRPAVLTIPCDVPFLPRDLSDRLAAAAGPAALAASDDDLHPACAWWAAETLDALPGYLASGRRSLLGFAETVGYTAVRWPGDRFLNVNSPADLAEAERRLASEIDELDRRAPIERRAPGP